MLVLTMLHLPTVTRAKVCEGAVSSIDGFAFICKVSDTSFHTFDFESLYPPPTQIAEGGCNVIILFAPALQFNFDYKTAGMSIVSIYLSNHEVLFETDSASACCYRSFTRVG